MAAELEVERLVARLMGDSSHFNTTMDDAVKQATSAVTRIESIVQESKAQARLLASESMKLSQQNRIAMQQQSAAAQDAARITASLETPAEKYAASIRNLNSHLNAGRITHTTYREAMTRAKKEYESMIPPVVTLSDKVRQLGMGLSFAGGLMSATFTAPIAGFLQKAAGAAMTMQRLEAGINAVAGSAEEAKKQMALFRDVARLPGLSLEAAVRGGVQMQTVGMSAAEAARTMKAFGNAVATTGGGVGELQSAMRQLMQMKGLGKVMGEELNIISESIPQFRAAIKSAFGTMDMDVIRKQMESGALSMDNFIARIVDELEKLPSVTGGVSNQLENLADDSKQALVEIGKIILEVVMPVLTKASEMLGSFAGWFRRLSKPIKVTIVAVMALVAAIGPLLLMMGSIVATIGVLMPIFAGIAAFLAGPFMAGVIGAVAVVGFFTAAITMLAKMIPPVGRAIQWVWDKIKAFGAWLWKHAKAFAIKWGLISPEEAEAQGEEAGQALARGVQKGLSVQQMKARAAIAETNALYEKSVQEIQSSIYEMERSADTIKLEELRRRMLTEAQLAHIAALQREARETKKVVEARKEARSMLHDIAKAFNTAGMEEWQKKLREFQKRGASDRELAAIARIMLATDINEYVASLRKEAEAIGKSAEELQLYRFAQRGASEEVLRAIKAQQDYNKALALKDKFKSPVAELQKELQDLIRFWQSGAIDDRTFRMATKDAKKRLKAIQDEAKIELSFTLKNPGDVIAGSMEHLDMVRRQVEGFKEVEIDPDRMADAKLARRTIRWMERKMPGPERMAAGAMPGKVPDRERMAAKAGGDEPRETKMKEEKKVRALERIAVNTDPRNQRFVLRSAEL